MGRVAQQVENRTEGKEWRLDAKAGQMRIISNKGEPDENYSHLQMRMIFIYKKQPFCYASTNIPNALQRLTTP